MLKSANLNLRINPVLKDALRRIAAKEHRSISNMIEFLIQAHCKKSGVPVDGNSSQDEPTGQRNTDGGR